MTVGGPPLLVQAAVVDYLLDDEAPLYYKGPNHFFHDKKGPLGRPCQAVFLMLSLHQKHNLL